MEKVKLFKREEIKKKSFVAPLRMISIMEVEFLWIQLAISTTENSV